MMTTTMTMILLFLLFPLLPMPPRAHRCRHLVSPAGCGTARCSSPTAAATHDSGLARWPSHAAPLAFESYEDPDNGNNSLHPFKPTGPPGIHFDHPLLSQKMIRAVEFFHLFFTAEMINNIWSHTNTLMSTLLQVAIGLILSQMEAGRLQHRMRSTSWLYYWFILDLSAPSAFSMVFWHGPSCLELGFELSWPCYTL